eukprot:1151098-Pelagomonas_calceolata.AAC.3
MNACSAYASTMQEMCSATDSGALVGANLFVTFIAYIAIPGCHCKKRNTKAHPAGMLFLCKGSRLELQAKHL